MARRYRFRSWVAFGAIAGLSVPAILRAIYISPTAVFLDDKSRTAQVTLGNSTDSPEEVTIELKFGFLDTDSAGTPFIRFVEDPGPEFPSAASWITVFPQRVRLEPGERRIVRLFARPPADLPEGEYWSRMIVTARRAPPALTPADTLVTVGVNLEIRLITSVTFRKGAVTTGIDVREFDVTASGDSLVARVGMAREGSGAFLGTAHFEVLDPAGTAVRTWATPIAVYYPVGRRFDYPLDGLAAGDYTVRLRVESTRADLEQGQALPAPPVTRTVAVRVN